MQVVTIREAKARLNALVEAALRGEQIVLMRGSEHVAAIVPVSAEDLELSPRLSDPQAERFWQQLAAERADGASLSFETPGEAIEHLSRPSSTSRRRPPRASGKATPKRR
jgi:antitoxin (DNA-binding transcriptional repressor) of toxin-antitoxin stability system